MTRQPPGRKPAPRERRAARQAGGAGAVYLALALVGGAIAQATAASLAPKEGDWETCKLSPGQLPTGDGWEPMNAVTDSHNWKTGGYPLYGKPRAVVVWKRRKPSRRDHPKPSQSLFAVGSSRPLTKDQT